jgi:hypothetical protein
VPGYPPRTLLNPVIGRFSRAMPPKGSKKGTNPAPWWWEPAICELWADGGKDARRRKFYEEAVAALDAVYGGPELATAWTKSNWGSAGECCADWVL